MRFDSIPPSFYVVLGSAVLILVAASVREQLKQKRVDKLEARVMALEKQIETLIRVINKSP